jgi:hypothetical protein
MIMQRLRMAGLRSRTGARHLSGRCGILAGTGKLDDWLAFGPGLLIRRRLAKNGLARWTVSTTAPSTFSIDENPDSPAMRRAGDHFARLGQ